MTDEIIKKKPRTIFVFSVAPGSKPMVTELPDTEDGHTQLSNLVRVEHVLAAVIGEKLQFALESVVSVVITGRKNIIDRQPIDVEDIIRG